jgi:hypothetical protein
LWNRTRWTREELPWLEAFDALVTPPRLASGPFPAGGDTWRAALEATGRFMPLSGAGIDHVQHVDADGLVALVASWSWIANLPERERTAVLAQVRELVGGSSELALRYRTELDWTRLA